MAAAKAPKQKEVPQDDPGPEVFQDLDAEIAVESNIVLEPKPKDRPQDNPADVDFRNQAALIAFREIVAWQIVNGKAGQEDVAASWAFRYGDRALAQSKKAPKGAPVMVRGHQEPVFEEPPNMGLPIEPVPPIAADAPGLPV